MKIKFKDILILFVLPSLISIPLLLKKVEGYNYIFSFLIFFSFTSVYLAFKKPNGLRNAVIFGVFGIFFNFLIEVMSIKGNTWSNESSFALLPGNVAIEMIIGAFIMAINLGLFYDNFIIEKENLQLKEFLLLTGPGFLIISLIFLLNQDLLKFSYYILGIGLILIPMTFILIKHPKLFFIFLKVTLLYFVPILLIDLINLRQEYISFNGNYIYSFYPMGFRLPLEEIIFWCLPAGGTFAAFYFFLFNREKQK